ncbi:MAG: hypothetical protein AAF563_22945 [Pseudomonadota bacterium]
MRLAHTGAALLAFTILVHDASADEWGTAYDVLLDRPDVEVEYLTSDEGAETRRFRLPGPVIVDEIRDGDNYRVWSRDASGLGAVQCAWLIYATTVFYAERCDAAGYQDQLTLLRTGVDRIEAFMQENWLVPMSDDDLVAFKANWQAQEEVWFAQSGTEQACENPHFLHMINRVAAMGEEGHTEAIDELLSVPRLPVANPCL